MTEPSAADPGPPDPADAATDAALRHWADAVVPLPPPPYSFERVLVRAHRRKVRRRLLAATASALCLALLCTGLAVGNLLPGFRSGPDCGAATNTVAETGAFSGAAAKGSHPMSRRTEYAIGGVLAAAALTAGVLAGCNGGSGSGSPSSSGTEPGVPNPGTSSSAPLTLPSVSRGGTPSSAPTGSGVTSSGTAVPQCHYTDLSASASVVAGSGAMGQEALNITLTNTSGHTCTVYGFPGLGLEDKNQDIQATKVTRNPGVAKKLITLANGGTTSTTAQFDVNVPGPGEPTSGPCEAASVYLVITPPNEQHQLVAPIGGTSGGITVCNNGALDVFAFISGSTGPNQ